MQYTLPRDAFEVLVDTFKDRVRAEKFAKAIEDIVEFSKERADQEITEKKELIKIELKEELKNELVTRDIFEERFNGLNERFKSIDERFKSMDERFKSIDERFKSLDFKLNIFIGLTLILLTFANPSFIELIKTFFGK